MVCFQHVIDCADPDRLARFWKEALRYEFKPAPEAAHPGQVMPGIMATAKMPNLAACARQVPSADRRRAGRGHPPDPARATAQRGSSWVEYALTLPHTRS
jgi:hypothetical protein